MLEDYETEMAVKFASERWPNSKIEVLSKIDVLHHGWECDPYAWVISVDGDIKVIATSHGRPCLEDAAFLRERLKYYQEVANTTEKVLAMLTT